MISDVKSDYSWFYLRSIFRLNLLLQETEQESIPVRRISPTFLILRGGGGSVRRLPWTETPQIETPRQRPTLTETPMDRDPLYKDPWTEIPRTKTPPGQGTPKNSGPGQETPRRSMGPGSQTGCDIIQRPQWTEWLTHTCENITLRAVNMFAITEI